MIESEYTSRQVEIQKWEMDFDMREMEIQKRQNELHEKRLKLLLWEDKFQNRQVSHIVTNGIVIKTIYNF